MTPRQRGPRGWSGRPPLMRGAVQLVGEEAAHAGEAGHRLEAAVAEFDDRDRREVGALPVVVRVDVAFDEGRGRQAARRRSASRASTIARASSHRSQSARRYRTRSGGAGTRRSSRSDCRRGGVPDPWDRFRPPQGGAAAMAR